MTIEDLVEEKLEKRDEHDSKEKPLITTLDNGGLLVDARTNIIDLERALGIDFSNIELDETLKQLEV